MQEILAITPRPTAVFAANNFIAFGALRALREAGARVPDDMSLTCIGTSRRSGGGCRGAGRGQPARRDLRGIGNFGQCP
jgi:Periplasmic binding protein-like domain